MSFFIFFHILYWGVIKLYDTYIVKKNDTIDSISLKYGTSPEVLYQLNGYEFSLDEGMTLIVPRRTSKYFDYYTVKKGDTLWAIAQRYLGSGTKHKEIKALNALNSDTIYPNQILKIPK